MKLAWPSMRSLLVLLRCRGFSLLLGLLDRIIYRTDAREYVCHSLNIGPTRGAHGLDAILAEPLVLHRDHLFDAVRGWVTHAVDVNRSMAEANVVIKRFMGRPPSYEVWSYPALTISQNAPWDFTISREQARCQHGTGSSNHQMVSSASVISMSYVLLINGTCAKHTS